MTECPSPARGLCRTFGARLLNVNSNPGLTAGPMHCRPFGPGFESERNRTFGVTELKRAEGPAENSHARKGGVLRDQINRGPKARHSTCTPTPIFSRLLTAGPALCLPLRGSATSQTSSLLIHRPMFPVHAPLFIDEILSGRSGPRLGWRARKRAMSSVSCSGIRPASGWLDIETSQPSTARSRRPPGLFGAPGRGAMNAPPARKNCHGFPLSPVGGRAARLQL